MKKAAQRRQLAQGIAQVAYMYGLPVETNPAEALLEELQRTAGHVRWLENFILNVSTEDELVKGEVRRISRTGTDEMNDWDEVATEARESVWMSLYFKERKHLVEVAKTMAGLGLAEAQIRINVRMAELFEAGMLKILQGSGVDASDPNVRSVIAEVMLGLSRASVQVELGKGKSF